MKVTAQTSEDLNKNNYHNERNEEKQNIGKDCLPWSAEVEETLAPDVVQLWCNTSDHQTTQTPLVGSHTT